MKLLILGGYGVFGGRLAELLADESALEILICGRSAQKAIDFCQSIRHSAKFTPVVTNRSDIGAVLAAHRPDLVVDASGPFQEYGDRCYAVVDACIAHGVDYVDFADGSEFVFGIGSHDDAARSADVFVLSGVSSFPVLTAAVVREFQRSMDVHRVTGGIAPSPYAGVGRNVMRAVLGYAGGQVRLVRNGKETEAGGLCESMRYTVAPPGRMPLRNLRYSLVDVPDLRIIPREYPDVTDIWMGAAPVPEFLHRILNGIAKSRRALRLPSLSPFAGICYWVINHLRFGEHRGGMFIDVVGRDARGPTRQSWHLIAEGDDGPYIPSMAIAVIVKRLLRGERPTVGARPAINELTLRDYDQIFAGRQIYTGFRRSADERRTLFDSILGECFEKLPQPLNAFHSIDTNSSWEGKVEIQGSANVVARVVAWIFGFPTTNYVANARVSVKKTTRGEQWHRDFGAARFDSLLFAGRGREERLLCERFGWITVALALVWDGEKLLFVPRRWRIGPITLPRFLLPMGNSFETSRDGLFAFDVRLELPFIGRIAAYRGTLREID